jgi:hypothetical protein
VISLGPAWIELGVNTEAKSSTAASKDLEKGLFISLFPSTGSEGQIGCASNSICLPCQLEGSKPEVKNIWKLLYLKPVVRREYHTVYLR